MKNILFVLFFIVFLFAENNNLKLQNVFETTITKDDKNIEFHLKLDKSVYVYDEFLAVIIKPQQLNITKDLKIKKPVKYHNFLVHFNSVDIKVPLKLIKEKIGLNDSYEIEFQYQGCSKKGVCYAPASKIYKSKQQIDKKPLTQTNIITQTLKSSNIFVILLSFFGFGLLLSLTPCVFPMIPILSSIIVHHTKKQNEKISTTRGFFLSLIYVLSMSVAYTIAGIIAGLFGANIQMFLQNPLVVVSFALIFVILAFSMFGYYEITLPQSWQNALNKKSNKKNSGLLSISIMGFLSALIVGPCVAPPLAGALIYIGQTGDAFLGGIALFVMSLGMGAPLLLVGAGFAKFMPKPGGWMMIISKIFGVIMLGIAIWMLGKIIPQTITMYLFVILFLGSAFYLIKNGDKIGKIIAVVLIFFSISLSYTTFKNAYEKTLEFQYVKTNKQLNDIIKNSSKPIMIDFWASWCSSCVEYDNTTFKNKEVQKKLKKYLLIKVDVTHNSKNDKILLDKFNLFGPPAIIFFENKKELKNKRIIGYKNTKEFLSILDK